MSLSESRGVQMSLSESKESNNVSRSGNSFATTSMMLPVITILKNWLIIFHVLKNDCTVHMVHFPHLLAMNLFFI